MMETWVERKGWERVKNKLPKGYRWGVQWATRSGRRGRAKGGMIMGVRKELTEEGEGIDIGTEGVMVGDITLEKTRILGVYVDRGIEERKRKVEGWLDKSRKGRRLLMGGDFNARIGREGGGYESENGVKRKRRAKDAEWG